MIPTAQEMKRITRAAREKGISLNQMAANLQVMTTLVTRALLEAKDHEEARRMILETDYTCLACLAGVHDICIDVRGAEMRGFVAICACIHPSGKEN